MSFAERLLADIDLFQTKGLAEIDADTRRSLLDWYGMEVSNSYAQEIAAWLARKCQIRQHWGRASDPDIATPDLEIDLS